MAISSLWGQVLGRLWYWLKSQVCEFKMFPESPSGVTCSTFLTGYSMGKSNYWNDENGCQKGTPFVWITHPIVFKIRCFLFCRSVLHISEAYFLGFDFCSFLRKIPAFELSRFSAIYCIESIQFLWIGIMFINSGLTKGYTFYTLDFLLFTNVINVQFISLGIQLSVVKTNRTMLGNARTPKYFLG